ncbi:MAG: glycosyltransferase [Cyanothece sp. SIO1E1]|nr:glycosyltransferase [Cyanothece sp. SIO1E1]
MVVIAAALVFFCLTGTAAVTHLFDQLYLWQENPPFWLEVPIFSHTYHLFFPTLILFLISQAVIRLSPQPQAWSRVIVVSILLALTIRYMLWRSLSTLNMATPLNGVLSIALLLMEMFVILSNSIQLYLLLKVKFRRKDADRFQVAVLAGEYNPSVDILVPTFNEPVQILKRTIMGCQALDYGNKQIYLLDDSKRQEMQELADELGCNYITRPNNRHAKAGNLNHALGKTNGELIIVFDADFVPTQNFISRTIGFFQNQTVGLVQTHQSFYNPDPVARNLGLEKVLTQEVEIFSRHYQVLRDGVETALCYGSSFVVRRTCLEQTGGFVTNSLSEDYFTGVRLSSQGCRVIYLNESLSAGLSASNMADHVAQRLRWTRGTLQAFFINSSPLIVPGIKPLQRLAHLEGILQWFSSVFRVGFLLMPLTYSFLGVIPLRITGQEWAYFFLPFYLVQLSTFAWLNYRSRSAFISDIYSVAQCFPIALTVIQTMISPFSKGFRVTPKGGSSDRFVFNWNLAIPLIITFVLMGVSLYQNVQFAFMSDAELLSIIDDAGLIKGIRLAWIWSAYNLFIIGLALLILLDIPKPDPYEWFMLERAIQLDIDGQIFTGVTTKISEAGAEIVLDESMQFLPDLLTKQLSMQLSLPDENLSISVVATNLEGSESLPRLKMKFQHVTLEQQRRLVELLFCRPGQWRPQQTPGELRSLWLMLKALLQPRILFDRKLSSS